MKKLTLIRHAKSSWNNPINDFKRPIIEEVAEEKNKIPRYRRKSSMNTKTYRIKNGKLLI
jgi:phosphohistidine phosphatase SixA